MKCLFATDFSAQSRLALPTLQALHQQFGCQVNFVNVASTFWKNWFASGRYEKEAKQRLSTWQEQLNHSNEEQIFVRVGNTAEQIIHLANELEVDLIVLGNKTQNEGRYNVGTTTQAVARGASQSVWVASSPNISNILCAVDFSEHSQKAMHQAIQLSRAFSTELNLVHVMPDLEQLPFGLDDDELKEYENTFQQQQQQAFEEFLKQFDLSQVAHHTHCLWGKPSNVIMDIAEDRHIDLVIMGAKGHSMLHHVFIGSTAEKVLRYSPCSTLLVR